MDKQNLLRTGLLGCLLAAGACGPQTPPPAGTKDVAAVEAKIRQIRKLPASARFAEMRTYVNSNMNIVCGRYDRAPDDPAQPRGERFVVWADAYNLERQMAPGAMDQTIARFCRNETASLSNPNGSVPDARG